MKLFAVAAVLSLAIPTFAWTESYTLSHDDFYDQKNGSLSNVACSNGEHGLLTHGYKTFDSLPTFPYIGGAPQIRSWDSPYCGSCWNLTYTNPHGVSGSLNFTAINTADRDPKYFIISFEGLDFLTDGHAKELGEVPITVTRLPKSSCGL